MKNKQTDEKKSFPIMTGRKRSRSHEHKMQYRAIIEIVFARKYHVK